MRGLGKKLWLDANERAFLRHSAKTWARPDGDGEILVDLYSVPETLIAYSYFLNALAEERGARIVSFSKAPRYPLHKFHRLYRSFGCGAHVNTAARRKFRERAEIILAKAWRSLRTKRDFLDLEVNGYSVGLDIYESYLRYFNRPTLDPADPKLKALTRSAIELLLFWEDYFRAHNVRALVLSHDCYIDLNIPAKVAFAQGIPVYLPNARNIHLVNAPFSVAAPFRSYHEMFLALPEATREAGLQFGRERLGARLGGEVGVDMSYSNKSAYHKNFSREPLLEKTDRFKVLICSHCFFDNPHIYGKLLHEDFYEWLSYLGRIAELTEYDWYVKVHPDPLPGTMAVIDEIIARFPRLRILPHTASHHQLVAEGIDFVLTAYGSVGHEYPLLGVPVMNAGFNPHIAYEFNWHPATLVEYEQHLLNLPALKKEISKKDVYEFYFMHYDYCFADTLLFRSHRSMEQATKQAAESEPFSYFLKEWSAERHREIFERMRDFIRSGRPFYFKDGPCLSREDK